MIRVSKKSIELKLGIQIIGIFVIILVSNWFILTDSTIEINHIQKMVMAVFDLICIGISIFYYLVTPIIFFDQKISTFVVKRAFKKKIIMEIPLAESHISFKGFSPFQKIVLKNSEGKKYQSEVSSYGKSIIEKLVN